MKKKVFVLISVLTMLMVFVSLVFADAPHKLLVNGQEIESDVPVQIIENRTFAPVRALAEALGATVSWDEEQGLVSVENCETNRISLLEEAFTQTTPLEVVNQWATGVKTRNGAWQYALLSTKLRQQTYRDYAELAWVTGTSSPWVEDFIIIEQPSASEGLRRFQVEFKLATSTGLAGSDWRKVTVSREEEKWVIAEIEVLSEPKEAGSIANPEEEERGTNVPQIPYHGIAYTDLPMEVQALVDRSKNTSTAQVIKGEGDTQYAFISLGARNTGGYEVEISSVEEVDGKILVIYQEKRPASGQMVIQVITYPWQVIQVDSPLPISIRKMV